MPFAQWSYQPELGRGEDAVRRTVPRRLHHRGDRPDARVVLHADGRGRAAFRLDRVPQRRVPRTSGRRGRPEDVEVARQRARPLGGAGPSGRRRAAVVDDHERLAVGVAPDRPRGAGRDRPPVHAHALERLRVLRDVRERGGLRSLGAPRRPSPSVRRSIAGRCRSSRDTVRVARDGLETYDATGAGRRDRRRSSTTCRTGTSGGRAGASGTRPATGRRRRRARRVPHLAHLPRDGRAAAGAVHAVPRRGAVAERSPRIANGAPASVHLSDYPVADDDAIDAALDEAMAAARAIVELGRRVRVETKTRTRQPLAEAVVHYPGDHRALAAGLAAGRRRAEREAGRVRRVGRLVRALARQAQLQGARPQARGPRQGGRGRAGGGRRRGGLVARARRDGDARRAMDGPIELDSRRRGPGPGGDRGLGRRVGRRPHGRARPRGHRRAPPRGAGARGRARRAGRAQGRRSRCERPDRRCAVSATGDVAALDRRVPRLRGRRDARGRP